MAGGTSPSEHRLARVALVFVREIDLFIKIRRRIARGRLGGTPLLLDALRQELDLLGRQVSTLGGGKCRHQRVMAAFTDDASQLLIRNQGEEQLVIEWRCRT